MIDITKIRVATFFKGIATESQIKQWIMDGYATGFYSFDETACLIKMLELEAA